MPWEALPGAGYPLICLSPVPFAAAVNTVSSWSPDGTLALDGFDDGDPSLDGIYLGRSSDGGGLRRLTILRDFPGDFSPDGRRLVFFRPEPADDNVGSLWVINVDGTGLTQLTPPTLPVRSAGRWSPDGRLILFAGVGASSDGAVWVVAPDGSGMRRVFHDPQGRFADSPAWSPDGTMIVLGLDHGAIADAYDPNGLYVIRSDGSGLALVLGGDNFKGGPDWVR